MLYWNKVKYKIRSILDRDALQSQGAGTGTKHARHWITENVLRCFRAGCSTCPHFFSSKTHSHKHTENWKCGCLLEFEFECRRQVDDEWEWTELRAACVSRDAVTCAHHHHHKRLVLNGESTFVANIILVPYAHSHSHTSSIHRSQWCKPCWTSFHFPILPCLFFIFIITKSNIKSSSKIGVNRTGFTIGEVVPPPLKISKKTLLFCMRNKQTFWKCLHSICPPPFQVFQGCLHRTIATIEHAINPALPCDIHLAIHGIRANAETETVNVHLNTSGHSPRWLSSRKDTT